MELPNPFKSQKIEISAWVLKEGENHRKNYMKVPIKPFEAMFNPNNFTVNYHKKVIDHKTLGVVKSGVPAAISKEPQSYNIKLLLDGTGVADTSLLGAIGFGSLGKSVKERIEHFKTICYAINPETHTSNFVKVKWGVVEFEGYLASLTINYTLFDQGGEALRAELDTTFISLQYEGDSKDVSSPDLTHTREVKAGDSLPLLAKEIYGSSRYYLLVAEANQLDDFRNLQPGMKLYFPPLEDQP